MILHQQLANIYKTKFSLSALPILSYFFLTLKLPPTPLLHPQQFISALIVSKDSIHTICEWSLISQSMWLKLLNNLHPLGLWAYCLFKLYNLIILIIKVTHVANNKLTPTKFIGPCRTNYIIFTLFRSEPIVMLKIFPGQSFAKLLKISFHS